MVEQVLLTSISPVTSMERSNMIAISTIRGNKSWSIRVAWINKVIFSRLRHSLVVGRGWCLPTHPGSRHGTCNLGLLHQLYYRGFPYSPSIKKKQVINPWQRIFIFDGDFIQLMVIHTHAEAAILLVHEDSRWFPWWRAGTDISFLEHFIKLFL